MTIVHIGLGKCATTSLQRHVFPKVANLTGYTFNDYRLKELAKKSTRFSLSKQEHVELWSILSSANHFLSLESLIDWNPAQWEEAAIRNLHLFGEDAKIIITLRDPIAWMTSVYQQMVHEGNVVEPGHFFLPQEAYCLASQISRPRKLEYFCSDCIDYNRLGEIYKSRFQMVKFVDISQLERMEFLDEIFDISARSRQNLVTSFRSAPRENRAYSSSAMALTFMREKLLKFCFGAKSIGSSDMRLEDFKYTLSTERKPNKVAFRNLRSEQKIAQFSSRSLRRFIGIFSFKWRRFIQKGYDKIIPYRRYKLPNDVYINWEKIEKCRIFLHDLKK